MRTWCWPPICTTALVVGAASAFQLLKWPGQPESRIALRMAIGMFALVAPLQLLVGDISGKLAEQVQPAKIAAVEALLGDAHRTAPLHIVAWPDRALQANRFEISIPKLGSWLMTGDPEARVPGLKAFARADQPPSFRSSTPSAPWSAWACDDRPGPLGRGPVRGRGAGAARGSICCGHGDGPGRLRRGDRRLDRRRGRPPALGGLRLLRTADAALAVHRRRGLRLADRLPGRLLRRVQRRRTSTSCA